MRNWKYIMLIFCVCFFTTVQAQDAKWTLEQTDKAKREVELIGKVITLTENQKVLLVAIFLDKNRTLERAPRLSAKRRNWNIKNYLGRLEDVLRYGYEINRDSNQLRFKQESNAMEAEEILSEQLYNEKVLNNDKLLKVLNLNMINE